MCRMGPHWRFKANEIPGLYVPRSDRNPSTYRGKTHDVLRDVNLLRMIVVTSPAMLRVMMD